MAVLRAQYEKKIDITDRLRILTIIGGQVANICILAKLLYLLLPKWDGSHGWFGTPVSFSNAWSSVRCSFFFYFSLRTFVILYSISFLTKVAQQIQKLQAHSRKKVNAGYKTCFSFRNRLYQNFAVCSHRILTHKGTYRFRNNVA